MDATISTTTPPRGPKRTAAPDFLTRRLATTVLLAAVLLGGLADALLRTRGLGINLPLWVAVTLAAMAVISHRRGQRVAAGTWALAVPVLFFASAFAWRDAEGLLLLNMLGMLTGFGVLALALSGWPASLRAARLLDFVMGGASLGLSAAVGTPLLVVSDGALSEPTNGPRRAHMLAVARGLLIAVPIVLVFGALLSSADARFERLIDTLIAVDVAEAVQHVVFAGFIAWVAGGYLRASFVAGRPLGVEASIRELPRPSLGVVELSVPLALVNLLFLTFVVLQLPYLFGGAAHLQGTAGLTAADYARRGFFELVVVAALVLPLLLGASALVPRDSARDTRVFRTLAGTMLVLLAVMMVSALQRLRLYMDVFGLSEDRIYATAIVVWLAIVFVLFAATTLRGRQAGFVIGAIVSGWIVVALLDVANPAAIVVRTNSERATRGATFDAAYAVSLGADAVPEMVAALPRVADAPRCTLLLALERTAKERTFGLPEDWRWWNASRTGAHRAAIRATANGASSACPGYRPAP